jgi:tetratricopeptide (TPR) repeat protein
LHKELKDVTIQDICSIVVKQGEAQLAVRLVEDINSSIIKSSTYINISEILYKKGETSLALSLLDKAQTLADKINDHENRCSLLVSISSELYNQGETQRALNLIEKATESVQYIEDLHGAKVGALSRIYSALVLQKEFALANEKINFAITHAKTIPNEFDKTNSIEKLSLAFAHQALFDEAIACAHLLEEYMKSGALMGVALALIKNNNIEKAISCISEMGKDWYGQDFALSCVVKELIQIGQIDKALQYVEQIGSENHKDDALTELSLAHINRDDFQLAIEFCSKISSAKIRNNCWKTIGSVYSERIGMETAIFNSKKIAENRNKQLYIYGIILSIKIDENAQDICKLIFPLCTSDYLNTKLLLEIYYTSELFYYSGTLPSQCTEFIDFNWALRLNKSLN